MSLLRAAAIFAGVCASLNALEMGRANGDRALTFLGIGAAAVVILAIIWPWPEQR